MNVIAWLEFELAYYDSAVCCFNHYTTRTPPIQFYLYLIVILHILIMKLVNLLILNSLLLILFHFNSLPSVYYWHNGWDLGSIPSWVIPKTQKWYLMPPCLTLSTIMYISRVKWGNLGKGVAPSCTPRYSSYRKGNLQVALN